MKALFKRKMVKTRCVLLCYLSQSESKMSTLFTVQEWCDGIYVSFMKCASRFTFYHGSVFFFLRHLVCLCGNPIHCLLSLFCETHCVNLTLLQSTNVAISEGRRFCFNFCSWHEAKLLLLPVRASQLLYHNPTYAKD